MLYSNKLYLSRYGRYIWSYNFRKKKQRTYFSNKENLLIKKKITPYFNIL